MPKSLFFPSKVSSIESPEALFNPEFMRKQSFYGLCFIFLLLFSACSSERTYTTEELCENKGNTLELALEEPLPDLRLLCEELSDMDLPRIERFLQEPGRGWQSVSYGLHYLGNRYIEAGQLAKGYRALRASALLYDNPLSLFKISQILMSSAELFEQDFAGQELPFRAADTLSSYRFLRLALASIEDLAFTHLQNYPTRLIGPFMKIRYEEYFMDEELLQRLQAQNPNIEEELEREIAAMKERYAQLFAGSTKKEEEALKPLPSM